MRAKNIKEKVEGELKQLLPFHLVYSRLGKARPLRRESPNSKTLNQRRGKILKNCMMKSYLIEEEGRTCSGP